MVGDQTQQVGAAGLDQTSISDAVNRSLMGYDPRKKREMMRLGTSDPNSFAMQSRPELQQAQQPQELLLAGRTDNTPASVTQDGYQLQGYDESGLQSLYNNNTQYQGYTPSYTDSNGKKYFDLNQQNEIEKLAPNYISGFFGSKISGFYDPNTRNAGGYYFADPWGFSHSLEKVNPTKYFVSGNTLNQHTRSGTADTFYNLDKSKDLSGLTYGNYNNQEGLFFDPSKTNLSSLLSPQRDNSAYAEKKSGGLLGSFNSIMGKVDPLNKFVESNVASGLGYDNGLDMVRQIGEPIGNIAGAVFSGGIPWGSIVMAADNASTGNNKAILGNVINGAISYAGQNGSFGDGKSVLNTGYDTGSVIGNKALSNMAVSTAANLAKNGGNLGDALKRAAFSSVAGAAGDWVGSSLKDSIGGVASKALGGAASGGLNSLFSKGNAVKGSLFGAMSGGLHGFLNSTNQNLTPADNNNNKELSKLVTNLARSRIKK